MRLQTVSKKLAGVEASVIAEAMERFLPMGIDVHKHGTFSRYHGTLFVLGPEEPEGHPMEGHRPLERLPIPKALTRRGAAMSAVEVYITGLRKHIDDIQRERSESLGG